MHIGLAPGAVTKRIQLVSQGFAEIAGCAGDGCDQRLLGAGIDGRRRSVRPRHYREAT